MCIGTELTLSLPAWRRVAGLLASLSPVDFLIFQMWQEEEVLVMEDVLLLEDSDSEMFLMAEGGSSADEADEACPMWGKERMAGQRSRARE